MFLRWILLLFLGTGFFLTAGAFGVIIDEYNPLHPRLLVQNEAEFQDFKNKILTAEEGSLPRKIYEQRVLGSADGMMEAALLYRLTGNPQHLDTVKGHIEQLCDEQEWEPYFMLDSAGYTRNLGFLYDLLYHELDVPSPGSGMTYRNQIKQTILQKGLNPYLVQHQRGHPSLTDGYRNWNHQLNSGAIIGALAVLDDDTIDLVQEVLHKAVPSLRLGIEAMNPDGFWQESVNYWTTVVLRNVVKTLESLNNTLGTDFGLSESEGLRRAGFFPMLVTGPTGFPLGYGDTRPERQRWSAGAGLFWLAERYDMPVYALDEIRMLTERNLHLRGTSWATLFFMPFQETDDLNLYETAPLDLLYGGGGRVHQETPQIAIFRSAWNDEKAFFGSLKGGFNSGPHRHLDLGAFELQALGEQWTLEIGYGSWLSSNYLVDPDIPLAAADIFRDYGFFQDQEEGGNRWEIYNVSARSHNVPLFNNQNQKILSPTPFERFSSQKNSAFAVLDLTAAYAGQGGESIRRGMKLLAGRNAFLIQDEYHISAPVNLVWGMSTDASISFSHDQRTAYLSKNGKTLIFQLLESDRTPVDAVFTWRYPEINLDIMTPENYEMQGRWGSTVSNRSVNVAQAEMGLVSHRSKGFKRLIIEVPDASGEITLSIFITPAGELLQAPRVIPLSQWTPDPETGFLFEIRGR
jgi:hypothetical protein